jgi:thioredoxin-related protein
MTKLIPGVLSPNFIMPDHEGNSFNLHAYQGNTKYKLLLFWSADCAHCMQLVNSIKKWYDEPGNKDKFDIVAVSLDQTETEVPKWNSTIADLQGWKHMRAEGGINSKVANDYFLLSTPVMFLIDGNTNFIKAVPHNLEELTRIQH